MKTLDSGLRRNDAKLEFSSFYETIKKLIADGFFLEGTLNPYSLHGTSQRMKVRDIQRKTESFRRPNLGLLTGVSFPLIDLWLSTCRPRVVHEERFTALHKRGEAAVIALWHAAFVYTLYHFRKCPAAIMVSGSGDGSLVASYIERHGQMPVLGSRFKGGAKAVVELASAVRDRGLHVGIVADGSRGPARVAQKGAVVIARETNAPILPIGMSARPCKRLGSWDRTILPLPFARVIMVYEEPIMVPKDSRGTRIEEYQRLLETRLNAATVEADRLLDH